MSDGFHKETVKYSRYEIDNLVPDGGKPMSEWKPIETAPKDGTRIDLWATNGNMIGPRRFVDCSWSEIKRGGLIVRTEELGAWSYPRMDKDHLKPTHWMLPPEPPK